MKKIITLSFMFLSLLSTMAFGADEFNVKQTKAIEQIMQNYMMAHPEIINKAAQAYQMQQMQEQYKTVIREVDKNKQALFFSDSPVIGNQKGNVTLIEFFDYQCSYCIRMLPTINRLIQNNKNLKVVLKEFPIFGAKSEYASRAALASQQQGKYLEFHNALMAAKRPFDEASVIATAKKVGLDIDKLKRDMSKNIYNQELLNNGRLASTLGIGGTPAFIFANTNTWKDTAFLPGGASYENMDRVVKELSKS